MFYQEFPPHPLLKDYIKTYWYFSYDSDFIQPFDIMPDGYFDLLLTMKNGCIERIKMTGVWSKMLTVNYSRCDTFGIRFRPQALAGLLNIRLKELLDSFIEADIKDWNLNKGFVEDNSTSSFHLLKEYFDKIYLSLIKPENIDKRLHSMFRLIDVTSGTISIETLSECVGLSPRQIQRKTNELIGVGPKDYAKIIRFNKSLELIKTDKSNYDGYFDQSHFIKNFKAYTGMKPSEVDLGNNVRFLQYYNFEIQ